jgi:hypothetical protein
MPLLNDAGKDADAVYLGVSGALGTVAVPVDAVYLGADKVWPQPPLTPGGPYRYLFATSSPNYDTQGVLRAAGPTRRLFNFRDQAGHDLQSMLSSATSMTLLWESDKATYYDGPVTVTDPSYHGVAVEMQMTGHLHTARDGEMLLLTRINGQTV